MYDHSGKISEAYRDFNGNPVDVGQTFSLELAVNFRNGVKGFDLRNSFDQVVFNLNIGSNEHVVNNAATGNGSISNEYSQNTEFAVSFTQTSLSGKILVEALLRKHSAAGNRWLAQRLAMGHMGSVSRLVGAFGKNKMYREKLSDLEKMLTCDT